ncbi:MAG: YtxH domain-containing protein [Magnetospirillum sp.]|nr:YtxH domain-containing protein [Magnetospirillum sp.]
MAKKKGKKSKEMKRLIRQMQAWNGSTGPAAGQGAGVSGGLSGLLPARRSDQFLLGLALGAGAAYLLADEQLRGKIMKSGVKLYASLAGGLAEMKEQMADIQAEVAAEQNGTL